MDIQAIKKLADLAKLSFTDEELQELEGHFQELIELVDQLQAVDTKEVAPTYRGIDLLNVTRPDQAEIKVSRDDLMVNVKTHKDGYIQVPAIMNDGNEGA